MSSSVDQITIPTTREDIANARKSRKKAEKQEREQKRYEEKLQKLKGPKDQKVQIIDEKFLEKYKQAQNATPPSPPPNDASQNNAAKSKKRAKQVLKYKNVIQIDLADCIQEKLAVSEEKEKEKPVNKVALPQNEVVVHKKKKEREIPKEKSLTKLKKNIINVREQKKENPIENDNQKAGNTSDKIEKNDEENIPAFLRAIEKCCQQPDPEPIPTVSATIQHSRNFRTYCDHYITPELLAATESLLRDIFRFQKKAYELNEIRAAANKRYVVGFHQVRKYLEMKALKLVVIAPDLEPNTAIDDSVAEIKDLCQLFTVPYIFSVKRRKLGFLFYKKVPVSCVGILNCAGSDHNFAKIRSILKIESEKYREIKNKNALC